MNRHAQFWLTLGTIYTCILFWVFFATFINTKYRIFGMLAIPGGIYFLGQFLVNYFSLTDDENK